MTTESSPKHDVTHGNVLVVEYVECTVSVESMRGVLDIKGIAVKGCYCAQQNGDIFHFVMKNANMRDSGSGELSEHNDA